MQDIEAAIVYRGWVAESHHRARIVVTNPDGSIRFALGEMEAPTLPRSSLKPFQVIAMLNSGLDLEGPELALAGASHMGEPFHIDAALSILEGAGLTVEDLRNTADFPGNEEAFVEWVRAGRGKERIAHNCSGKHTAMVRTCVRAGWPLDDYRSLDHPLQIAIAETIDNYCGLVGEAVPDGCTAPAFAVTLPGLARGFGRMAASGDSKVKKLVAAFGAHPEYVSGTGDPTVAVHRSIPGSITKLGAEGILATGLPDGTGVALKVSDGANRARFDVLAAVLKHLGHPVRGMDASAVVSPVLLEALRDLG